MEAMQVVTGLSKLVHPDGSGRLRHAKGGLPSLEATGLAYLSLAAARELRVELDEQADSAVEDFLASPAKVGSCLHPHVAPVVPDLAHLAPSTCFSCETAWTWHLLGPSGHSCTLPRWGSTPLQLMQSDADIIPARAALLVPNSWLTAHLIGRLVAVVACLA